MSVAPFRKSELENIAGSLHEHLTHSGFQTWEGYRKEDTYRVIAVAGIANQTAIFLTYGSEDNWDDMRDLDATTQGNMDAQTTCRRIKSLMYNCISNGGTECLPTKYTELLEAMILSIAEKAAWRRT